MLIGKEAVQKLHNSKVAVFGLGGVGSFVTEGLARAGIENFVLVDNDVVDITNLNRQLIATHKTIGKNKVDVMKERILDINPSAKIETFKEFFMPDSSHDMIDDSVDYIVDAVDTVTAKIELVMMANKMNIPIISAMGTGNKLDPTKFEVTDIYKTEMCPLAKVMRKELKARGIKKLKVVYSKENPIKTVIQEENINNKKSLDTITTQKQVPASISFVPSVAGLIIAGEVVKDLHNT
ncbi:MAG: tRNA threonylcarbamoyladenosine dehydratase [Clostridia bacterium]|nr:tRNA threonylcarbamoyladenosine dehydratase [Clostridia bacterium]